MTTTDPSTAERLIALERRHAGRKSGKRRRPAESSRVLAAGAGTAAVLTMVTAMAQADRVVEVVEAPVFQTQPLAAFQASDGGSRVSPYRRTAASGTAAGHPDDHRRSARSGPGHANARTSASR